jgi:hypothetical protein
VRIVPFTVLLLLGQMLPAFLLFSMAMLCVEFLVVGARFDQPLLAWAVGAAIIVAFVSSYVPRLLAVRRFRQPLLSALVHPLGVALLLVVQWYAFIKELLGRPVAWRERSYSTKTGREVD